MKISTVNTIPEFKDISIIEPIFSEYVSGINVLKDLSGSIKALIGKRTTSYEKDIIKARQIVLEDLKEKAITLKADGIIGLQFQYSQIVDNNISLIIVYGSGTAIKKNSNIE